MHATASEPVAELRGAGVSFRGRGWVFRHLDLDVMPRDRIAIVGPSGSGKSTLLAVLGGFTEPSEGEARQVARRHVALLHQTNPMLPRRTVADNVAIAVAPGVDSDVAPVLEAVGLLPWADRRAITLSGGEAQRLCVARAMAQRPALVLADEPTGQLDAENSLLVARLLANPPIECAVVVATHDPTVAAMFDRVVELR